MSTDLPDIIDTYQQAHDRRDTDTALAMFSADPTVVDEGHTYTGIERSAGGSTTLPPRTLTSHRLDRLIGWGFHSIRRRCSVSDARCGVAGEAAAPRESRWAPPHRSGSRA
jgi:hypothetical protein